MKLPEAHRLLPRDLRSTLLLLLLVVLLPLLLVQTGHYYGMLQMQRTQALEANLELARAVAGTFEAYVNDIRHQSFAVGLALTSPPLSSDQANELLAIVAAEYPSIDSYSWADPHGRIVASSLAEAIGLDISDRPYFQEIVAGREWVVSDLILGRVTLKPAFVVVQGVRDERGVLLGIVTAGVDPQRLDEVLAIGRFGQAAIVIVDRQGRLVYRYPELELTWEQRNVIESDPTISLALAGEETTGAFTPPLEGQRRIVVRVPISSIGWVAGASRPETEVMAPIFQDLLWNFGLILLVAVLALLVALAIGRNITGPIRRLQEHALALGRGDLSRRVEVGGPTELQRLGDSFNAMAAEVQRALRLREEFLTVAAHELRTPLTVIRGYSQLLLREETDENRRTALAAVVKQVDRMTELLSEMLAMSEIRAGRMALHKEKVDLAALVGEAVNRMQLTTDRHRLLYSGGVETMVEADRNQIEVVVTNLIDNAIRYSPMGGDVEVAVSKSDGEAIVSVTDHGLGIPEEKQNYVFEPFFQAQPAIAGYGGLGLGLYISKQTVERHGGRMWFRSEEGKGSTFFFILPLEGPAHEGRGSRVEG